MADAQTIQTFREGIEHRGGYGLVPQVLEMEGRDGIPGYEGKWRGKGGRPKGKGMRKENQGEEERDCCTSTLD